MINRGRPGLLEEFIGEIRHSETEVLRIFLWFPWSGDAPILEARQFDTRLDPAGQPTGHGWMILGVHLDEIIGLLTKAKSILNDEDKHDQN